GPLPREFAQGRHLGHAQAEEADRPGVKDLAAGYRRRETDQVASFHHGRPPQEFRSVYEMSPPRCRDFPSEFVTGLGSGGRHNSWWDRRSAVGVDPLPEGLPLAFFAPVEGAEMTDGVGPLLPPPHAGRFQALAHHRLAGALHRPAADAPAPRQI